jgi:hypothetical protein
MADQGALGRQHAIIANSAINRAALRYRSEGEQDYRDGYSGIAFSKAMIVNSALNRAKLHYTREIVGAWQGTTGPLPFKRAKAGRKTLRFLPMTGDYRGALRCDGSISGTVTASGTPQVGVRLLLIWKAHPLVIASTLTDANGYYSFTGLDPTKTEGYAVIAFDLETGTDYNIGRLDRLTAG